MHILFTTDNCNNCERVKSAIKNQEFKIEIKKATEENIEKFIEQDVTGFPVLTDENLEVLSYGEKTGYYIFENMEKFK